MAVRIKQGRVSPSIRNPYLKTYGLRDYDNVSEPNIFFGCYNLPKDFNTIINHKGLGIMVWCGTDAQMISKNELMRIASKKNIKHVARSSFIEKDLKRAGIKYVKLPLINTPIIPNPIPLGKSVYTYAPTFRYDFYGGKIIDRLKKETDYDIIVVTSSRQYSQEDLYKLYAKAFIGLRLTLHDALPHTTMELGLLGRRCVFNDDVPGAISWNNYDDVLRAIKSESANIGKTNYVLAHDTAAFLTIPDDWLHTKFWT